MRLILVLELASTERSAYGRPGPLRLTEPLVFPNRLKAAIGP